MAKDHLGDTEELILTLVAILQEEAYGAAISEEIRIRLQREITLSAIHIALYKLEDKGYIRSRIGGATNERGGRRKRIYTITSAGLAMLRAAKDERIELWKSVPQFQSSLS